MFSKLKKIFDLNSAVLKKTDKPLAEIKKNIEELQSKSFIDFRTEIQNFRNKVKKLVDQLPQESFLSLRKIDQRNKLPKPEQEIIKLLNEFMPRFYAMINEVYKRKFGITYHDVQLRAGIILAQGQRLVELATGEGKTMTFQLPLFLYALAGRGSHLVTVNDYLSKRDGEYAGHVAVELGLSLGIITSSASYKFISDEDIKIYKTEEDVKKRSDLQLDISKMEGLNLIEVNKKDAYNCDITYGTNNEFGFDYLRDNMSWDINGIVQRELYYCIIDEADSILIDEARTPLIISGMPSESNIEKYITFANAVRDLEENKHYVIDHKSKSVSLTEEGIQKVESFLGIDNLWKDYSAAYHIENALKAKALFIKDDQYLVRNGEVLIVDEFTGRILPGRRYSEGLHQAIEAKEGVEIKQESKIFATITFQNYFRLYKILGGGSGTIMTEAEEFYKIYGLESVPIPTHKPVIRKDYPDLIFKTQEAKFRAVIQEVKERHSKGQPILIGTVSVEKSELVSALLTSEGIDHQVLNAKHHEKEAKIIEKAGRKGAVTVATNMAGRGADIVIGGGRRGDKEYYEVMELGGLHVIGTERHEARRIDNQLRGRTGRQGEPGSSRFYVSLEDQLMKILGGEILQKLMGFVGMKDDSPIEFRIISKQIETAQKRIEYINFDNRKRIVEYDDVMNFHREIFYTKRRNIISVFDSLVVTTDSNLTFEQKFEKISSIINSIVNNILEQVLQDLFGLSLTESFLKNLLLKIKNFLPDIYLIKFLDKENKVTHNNDSNSLEKLFIEKLKNLKSNSEIFDFIFNLFIKSIRIKFEEIGENSFTVFKLISLQSLDNLWVDHLEIMKDIRESIALQSYAQKDPLVEYKNQAFVVFGSFIKKINKEIFTKFMSLEKRNFTDYKYSESKQLFTNTEEIDDISTGDREFLPTNLQIDPDVDIKSIEPAKKLVEKLIKQRQKQESTLFLNSSNTTTSNTSSFRPSNSVFKNVGRNDPCPCGSGKKFKKCHGMNT